MRCVCVFVGWQVRGRCVVHDRRMAHDTFLVSASDGYAHRSKASMAAAGCIDRARLCDAGYITRARERVPRTNAPSAACAVRRGCRHSLLPSPTVCRTQVTSPARPHGHHHCCNCHYGRHPPRRTWLTLTHVDTTGTCRSNRTMPIASLSPNPLVSSLGVSVTGFVRVAMVVVPCGARTQTPFELKQTSAEHWQPTYVPTSLFINL